MLHGGDLEWVRWGEGQFSYYPELQRRVFDLPVGRWEGPIQQGNEYHFIRIEEERPVEYGDLQQARMYAASRLADLEQRRMEQDMSNRMWQRGSYRLNQDHFRWLVDEINRSFEADPARNPIPEVSREDGRRVVIESPENPYTARELLDRLALLSPQSRDNQLDINDWRQLFVEWVLTDEAARDARRLGYDEDPGFLSEREKYIDGRLYALNLSRVEEARGVPTDEDLERHRQEHPEEFELPEMRRIVEVLLPTRDEAEDIRRRALAGEPMTTLAAQYTIREGYRQRNGRFAPISPGEFGELGEAVFAADPDTAPIGPVVESPLGYSVFEVVSVSEPRTVALDEVRENLRIRLQREWERENRAAYIEEQREQTSIWRNEELLDWYTRTTFFSLQQQGAEPDSVAPPGR
jgi:parvulin-like peptidyl-prolyl isomerase